ncbi:MAG: hypothetical protein KatS3mg067_2043 [Thermosynechococcus sp.]|nr:hypothetical protein [Thermosynechococcus sp.]BCX13105.1 MAG: hypothetical protein KatS3mg067_2043 [Thermosynechococcus sp.]
MPNPLMEVYPELVALSQRPIPVATETEGRGNLGGSAATAVSG